MQVLSQTHNKQIEVHPVTTWRNRSSRVGVVLANLHTRCIGPRRKAVK